MNDWITLSGGKFEYLETPEQYIDERKQKIDIQEGVLSGFFAVSLIMPGDGI